MKSLLSLLAVLFFVAACSGKPNDTQISQALENEMSKVGIAPFYIIKDFQKTNGVEKDEKTYIADVVYVVAMKEDAWSESNLSKVKPELKRGGTIDRKKVINTAAEFFRMLVAARGMRVTEKLTLIQSDNGWIINDRSEDKTYEVFDSSGQWRSFK